MRFLEVDISIHVLLTNFCRIEASTDFALQIEGHRLSPFGRYEFGLLDL
jgi:hypothetical protein